MIIKNETKNITLSKNISEAKTWKDKTIGLLGSTEQKSVCFKTRFGIHTFGMKRPIDVLILDQASKVVALKDKLVPNRIFLWNPRYDFIVELPEGIIKQTKTVIGDTLLLKSFEE